MSLRRHSLATTAVAAGLFTLVSLAAFATSPAQAQGDVTRIVFASGPDDTGTVKRMIETFNAANRDRIEVTWREMDRDNSAHHRQLVADFEAESGAPDVIAADVVWTAQFAQNGWVENLSDMFYDSFERADFRDAALKSTIYRMRIWGVPWYTDASLLYYRKDSLAASGYKEPPKTWDEMIEMSGRVTKASGIRYGMVFQGADYEGGTANAMEFIWSAGGDVMHGEIHVTTPLGGSLTEYDAVTINSSESAAGLDVARRLIAEGVAPAEVTGYREREALDAFLAGDAVFLRSWPYVQGLLGTSSLSPDQVGIGLLPGVSTDEAGYSCLGGWNLMINADANRAEREAAWALILYLTDASRQKQLAMEAGLLPALEALYADRQILEEVPVAALLSTAGARIRVRPASPFYADLSAQISDAFQRVLRGESDGTDTVASLDESLRETVMRNR